MSNVSTDVTEEMRAEKDLDRFFNLSIDMLCIAGFDGYFKRLNPAWERTLGFTTQELMAQPYLDFVHPEDREATVAEAQKLASGMFTISFENRYLCKDGSYKWLSWNAAPAEGHRLIYAIARNINERRHMEDTLRRARDQLEERVLERTAELARANAQLHADIQDRRSAEEALRASEERYRLLFESSPEPIWVYDLDTLAFLAVNQAAVKHYGYSQEEFSQMTIKDIRPREGAVVSPTSTAKVLEELDNTGVWKHRKKDGTVINVEVVSHSLTFSGRRARLVMVRDVTERRRLEEQLRQSQKIEAVGQLAGGIAHDFNNLLGVIIGYSEVLTEELAPEDSKHAKAEEIKKAGERAASLTRQLLAFSRQQMLEPKVLVLNAVVSEMDNLLRRLIGEHIELVTLLSPDLGRAKTDPGQLEQVILNLAVNARDAMLQGGKLTLQTANVEVDEAYAIQHPPLAPGRYVTLTVSDTGSGMDAQTQAHIFEPFFTTKKRGKGTGLGLATVYGIVKQSGGFILVNSQPGEGSTFKIYLPLIPEAVETREQSQEAAEVCRGSETILVVEDAEPLRKLTREFLQSSGYTVLDAGDTATAIRIAQLHRGPIHLLLSDVVMPGMGGPRLAEWLTRLRPKMKVLYMSGYTNDAIMSHGIQEGSTDLLQKPFTRDALARKVRDVLDEAIHS